MKEIKQFFLEEESPTLSFLQLISSQLISSFLLHKAQIYPL